MNRGSIWALPTDGLVLFRRGLAVLCFIDVLQRLTQAQFFYSDLGVLPRAYYYAAFDQTFTWSLFLISGQPLFAVALLVLAMVVALIHVLGRDSRWSRVTLWLLMTSAQSRHPGILDSSDDLLRLMLFFDMLAPAYERSRPPYRLVSLSTIGIKAQLSFVLVLTIWQSTPQNLSLAAQWYASGPDAFSPIVAYLGGAGAACLLVGIYAYTAAPFLLALGAALLFPRAFLLDPWFPSTLLVACTCSISRGAPKSCMDISLAGAPSALAKSRWLLVAAASLLCVLLLAQNTSRRESLKLFGQGLGFHQDWTRVYPLASSRREEFVFRASGYPRPLLKLSSTDGRRLRLYAKTLAETPGLATPAAVSLGRSHNLRIGVDIWKKDDYLSPSLVLPRVVVTLVGRAAWGGPVDPSLVGSP